MKEADHIFINGVPRHWVKREGVVPQMVGILNQVFADMEAHCCGGNICAHFVELNRMPLRYAVPAAFPCVTGSKPTYRVGDFLNTYGYAYDHFLRIFKDYLFSYYEVFIRMKCWEQDSVFSHAMEKITSGWATCYLLKDMRALSLAPIEIRNLFDWFAMREIRSEDFAFDLLPTVDDFYARRMACLFFAACGAPLLISLIAVRVSESREEMTEERLISALTNFFAGPDGPGRKIVTSCTEYLPTAFQPRRHTDIFMLEEYLVASRDTQL